MENFALTMRETANQVNNNRDAEKRAKHEEMVESEIIPLIKAAAGDGEYQLRVRVATGYSRKMVRLLLREIGFTVELLTGGTELLVLW